ncbi:glycosyltransferase family 2 protein [Helicobacter anatolicus]|uniref:glycosyltransferase family 2 protein n=1 Tax=Helicobacter anatolicus TaxID=2905874 RepID=UPI001E3BF8FE|nr:glycosyltransferase [Helicobacter anatolicus]MCE3038301.1 glycosyltransferase [Helicobacter anatolicus]
MPFFSIIIPIYNVENYLKECLDSAVFQTFRDIEIICINDGSSDKSGEIAKEYAEKDSRILLIHQENQGPSIARNNALKIAQGKYIIFLDSDDYIEKNLCEKLYEILQNHPVDVLLMDFFHHTKNNKIYKLRNTFYILQPNKIFSSNEALEVMMKYYKKHDLFITTIAHFVVKNQFIKDHCISFDPDVFYYEDILFCTNIFLKAQTIYNSDIRAYYYVLTPNSIMRGKYNQQKLIKSANSYYYIAKILKEQSLQEVTILKKNLLEKESKTAVHKLLSPLRKLKYHKDLHFNATDLYKLNHHYSKIKRININHPVFYQYIHPLVVSMKYGIITGKNLARRVYAIFFNHYPHL